MTDDDFLAAFEDSTLPREEFTHHSHVRMGFLYMSRFAATEGIDRFARALKRYALLLGKPNLYHETITWAFLLLIRERMARGKQQGTPNPTWEEFAAANRDLLTPNNHVLKRYYTDETLRSELAKSTFVMPDRLFFRDNCDR